MAFEGWQENIDNLVNEVGRDCFVRSIVVTGGNDFDPSSGTEIITDTPAKAAFFKFKTNEVDGTVIKSTDKKIVLSSAVPVDKTNKIVDGSIIYHIEQIVTSNPANEIYMYILQGRA